MIGIPLLSIILYCTRLVFNTKIAAPWRSGMWTFWMVNLVSFLFIGNFVWREFNQRTGQEIAVTQLSRTLDTIQVKLSKGASDDVLNRLGGLLIVGDEMLSENIELHIRKSDNDQFELSQWNYARGRDRTESDGLIEKINYPITIENNTLVLPSNFSIPNGTKWRKQKVDITLKVPEGKMVDLDRSLRYIDVWVQKDHNVDQPWNPEGMVWQMNNEGMICPEYLAEKNFQRQWSDRGFTKVQVEGRLEVKIEKGANYSVVVKGREEIAEKVEVFKIGNTLNVTANLRRRYREPLTLYITMPSLKELDVEETEDVELRGFKEKDMAIRHEGARSIKAFIDVDSLTIRQEGHNTMDISGAGRFLEANVSDGSKLNTERFPVMVANLKASDRGYVKANVKQTLHREVDGRSKVEIEGNPEIPAEVVEETEAPEQQMD